MLKQSLSQRLTQKLSPQQIQLMKLVELPSLEFEQRVMDELEDNPALETGNNKDEINVDDDFAGDSEHIETGDLNVDEYLSDDEIPQYKLQANNYSTDDEYKSLPLMSGESLGEYLLAQAHTLNLNEHEWEIAEFIIGNIDELGYLRRDLQAICDDLAFTLNVYTDISELERILLKIQNLEPIGIAARNLQECLSIQLRAKENSLEVKIAQLIIDKYFEEFTKKHFDKIVEALEVDTAEVKSAFEEIAKLNPKPGAAYSGSSRISEHITPDFIVSIEENNISIILNHRNSPELNISRSYTELFETYKNDESNNKELREAVGFVKQKLDNAKWFIEAVKQRQNTLMLTMQAIVSTQKAYFLSGDEGDIKPMILKDIADMIGMDISTISRVVNSKYALTPYGTILLKNFFTESIKNEQGEDISTREIKVALAELIKNEDKSKPIADLAIVDELAKMGYILARRTVAKYREQLGIPVARLRKEIKE